MTPFVSMFKIKLVFSCCLLFTFFLHLVNSMGGYKIRFTKFHDTFFQPLVPLLPPSYKIHVSVQVPRLSVFHRLESESAKSIET